MPRFLNFKQSNPITMTIKKEYLKIIEDNRNTIHFTKYTCKIFVKVLKDLRGETTTKCFCAQSERDSYGKYFYEQYDQIINNND